MQCKGFLVQHHSGGLSQTKNILNSVSRDDFTNTKLAPDNNANTADPPNNVVETKDKGVVNVVEYIVRKDS